MDQCLSPYNWLGIEIGLPPEVILCDVTMRDGEKTPGVAFTLAEKIELAKELEAIGVPQIQVGVPGSSKNARQEVEAICQLGLASKTEAMTRGTYEGWQNDIEAALSCGADILHSYLPMSPYIRSMYAPLSDEQMLQRADHIIQHAQKWGAKIINISLLDATRAEENFLWAMIRRVAEKGVDRIRIADTVGTATPEGIFYLIRRVREAVDHLKKRPLVGLHCHNDFGLALANVFAGVKAGATLIDVSVNGLGERSGNPSLAEVAIGLEILYKVKTHIRLDRLYDLAKLVERISGLPIPTNKPLVGEYVFADESDAHVAAILKEPFAFQGVRPELLGNKRKFVIGKSTGPHVLNLKSKELGLNVSQDLYPKIMEGIREKSEKRKGKILTDEELIEVIEVIKGQFPR
ncbi:MAG: 2-isopropylmalate synthase [Deltaproteobacteria bacterium]|nr:2-isopropylmalate synthase [Deltaproteobacteria bacterium]